MTVTSAAPIRSSEELAELGKALTDAVRVVRKTHIEIASIFSSLDKCFAENDCPPETNKGKFPFRKKDKYIEATDFCPREFSQYYICSKTNTIICVTIYLLAEDANEEFDGDPQILCEVWRYAQPIGDKLDDADSGDEERYKEEWKYGGILSRADYHSEPPNLTNYWTFYIRFLAIEANSLEEMLVHPLVRLAKDGVDGDEEVRNDLKRFEHAIIPWNDE